MSSCKHVNCLINNEVHILQEAFGHEDLTNDEFVQYIDVSGEELKRRICIEICPYREDCEISKGLSNGSPDNICRA